TLVTSRRNPVRAAMSSARVRSSSTSGAPTLPQPRTPTRTTSVTSGNGSGGSHVQPQEIFDRLPPDDNPRIAPAAEHNGGPRHLVVVRAHRVAVCAGDGCRQQIADGDIVGHER